MNKTLMPRYIFEFDTTAERIAYAFGPNDRGCLVIDNESGLNYVVVAGTTGALAMVAQGSGYGTIPLHLGACWLASTGAPLAVFTSEDQPSVGTQLTNSKALTLRWNNHASPTAVGCAFDWPADMDLTVIPSAYFDVSKSGATVGDATKITVAAYNQVVGALHDADTNYGGDSDALVGNATAKTISRLTRAFAVADLPAAVPCAATITFGPKSGTLGTDDLIMHSARIIYRRK